MAGTETRSLQQIKRDTEQTRAGLTETVEQLRGSVAETITDVRERISPAAIKQGVSDYVRSRGEQLRDDVTTAARDNPMQALAVGAMLGYPMLRIVRSIPLPILMVGAGLYLAGSKTGKNLTQKASDIASDVSGEIAQRARGMSDAVSDAASDAGEFAAAKLQQVQQLNKTIWDGTAQPSEVARATLSSGTEQVRSKVASAADALAERGAKLGEQTNRLAGSLGDQTNRLAGSLADTATDLAGQAASAGAAARDSALGAARSVASVAAEAGERAKTTVSGTLEKNPLLVAGVGLLIGGIIASALPRTDLEDDLIGETSARVKRRARQFAAQGVDVATDAAGEVYDRAARQAEAEGLDPDGLSETARDVGHRLKRVAETAVTTAFEPPDDDQEFKPQGAKDHG